MSRTEPTPKPALTLKSALSFKREPLGLVALLWPLALLAPFIPGLPRPANGGFTWRQELTVALLISATFALMRRRAASRGDGSDTAARVSRLSTGTLAAFVAWAAASALWAANFFAAAHYALSWVEYLLLFVLLARAFESRRVLSVSLKVLGAVVLIIAAANVVGHFGSRDSLLRQNGLGEPLAICVPLFAALALCVRRRRAALLAGLTSALAWLAVLQIAERAAFVAMGAGLLVLAVAMLATPRFRPRGLSRVALLTLAFVACLALQFTPTPFEQSKHQPVLARLGATSTEDLNARARFLYWGAAVEMWRAHPLKGVGANNFSTNMPEARAAFAASHPRSPLSGINEKYLNAGAHNEYLQILAELGAAGLALFVAFCAALMWAAWRALRVSRSPLAPGAVASLVVFAVSSGASAVSFRWMGSGLVFFFAAALVTRLAAAPDPAAREVRQASRARVTSKFLDALARPAPAVGLALSLLVVCVMATHATHVQLIAAAQSSNDPAQVEALYRASLAVNPLNAAAHNQFGMWLFHQGREGEAAAHLAYALDRGFNTSTCFAYLAGAESNSGREEAAERTLARAARAFPRSVFVRTRHAASLARLGRTDESELEMATALLLDSRTARSWRRLIDDDIDAAAEAARRDPATFAAPGELQPDDALFVVLKENERRFPEAARTGWRARMRSN